MSLFQKLFHRNITKKLSKEEYWQKWELSKLLEDLHSAERILSKYKGGYSGQTLSAEEFHEELVEAIDDVEFGNRTYLSRFWNWFAPTCEWDDFMGEEGVELGNRIFERVDRWKKAHSNN